MESIPFSIYIRPLYGQPYSSKLQKLLPLRNYPATFPPPRPNICRTYQEMEVGTRVILGGPGQEDRGE